MLTREMIPNPWHSLMFKNLEGLQVFGVWFEIINGNQDKTSLTSIMTDLHVKKKSMIKKCDKYFSKYFMYNSSIALGLPIILDISANICHSIS